jgi:hypothetical protein
MNGAWAMMTKPLSFGFVISKNEKIFTKDLTNMPK